MLTTFPGTVIETLSLSHGCSQTLFDGIFATGGITLSQVSIMTGLEPYLVQNWVKRGFVSSPTGRVYSREQFARIAIINMLREALQIDRICELIGVIGGDPQDTRDDLIGSEELYHRYVDMLISDSADAVDVHAIRRAAELAAADFVERTPGAKKALVTILSVMRYAHTAAIFRETAEKTLAELC